MRHFYRTHMAPADVIAAADAFFAGLGLTAASQGPRERVFKGVVGTPEVVAHVRLTARPEGGHYTFVEVHTDQMGESRVDRNVKKFFVGLHRHEDTRHQLEAAY
ncbi:MAG: hypothetical protein JNL26_03180 [Gemmatimonadetes bacterium]|nr:hypothetical protein [Gemmatimonadota bacterium]